MEDDILKPETKELYEADAARYFRNVQSTKQPGISADDRAIVDRHLPSKKEEQKKLEYLEKGFSKTSRSGAFSKAGSGPAIFPSGLKFASDFIDAHTPGHYKPQEAVKPPTTQEKPTGWFPKPAAVVDICIDCMKQIDPKAYHGGIAPITEEDSQKCYAMGVKYGDLVIYCICDPCMQAAKELSKDSMPLALVFGGSLKDANDVALAMKYGFPIHFHDGVEKTMGQWAMIERQERILNNLWGYLKSENEKPESPVFRNKLVA